MNNFLTFIPSFRTVNLNLINVMQIAFAREILCPNEVYYCTTYAMDLGNIMSGP